MSIRNRLYRTYISLLSRWPADPLRPDLSFQEAMHNRLGGYFGVSAEAGDLQPSRAPPKLPNSPIERFDAKKIEGEMNVIASLLEDRYKKEYPVSEVITRPKGNPQYYERLVRELEDAPKRGWLRRKLEGLKGWVRLT